VIEEVERTRLQELVVRVEKERKHLQRTDARLFAAPFTPAMAERLERDEDLAESTIRNCLPKPCKGGIVA